MICVFNLWQVGMHVPAGRAPKQRLLADRAAPVGQSCPPPSRWQEKQGIISFLSFLHSVDKGKSVWIIHVLMETPTPGSCAVVTGSRVTEVKTSRLQSATDISSFITFIPCPPGQSDTEVGASIFVTEEEGKRRMKGVRNTGSCELGLGMGFWGTFHIVFLRTCVSPRLSSSSSG